MGFKRLLNRVLPKWHPLYPLGEEWKATRDVIRQIVSPCPVCNQLDLSGHQFGSFASQIAIQDSHDLEEFFSLYKARHWRALNSIQRFDGRFNAAIIYVLNCKSGTCMLAVRDPEELYDHQQLLDFTPLGESEILMINSLQIELYDL